MWFTCVSSKIRLQAPSFQRRGSLPSETSLVFRSHSNAMSLPFNQTHAFLSRQWRLRNYEKHSPATEISYDCAPECSAFNLCFPRAPYRLYTGGLDSRRHATACPGSSRGSITGGRAQEHHCQETPVHESRRRGDLHVNGLWKTGTSTFVHFPSHKNDTVKHQSEVKGSR